ncbi:glycosyltransferase family 87 protein [Actinomycetota bacterium]
MAENRWPALVLALAWLAYFGVLQWSVVRFRVPIVLTLAACAVLLGAWQFSGRHVRLSRPAVGTALAGSALLTLLVPLFSYLPDGAETAVRWLLAATALGCAGLLLATRVTPLLVAGLAALAHVVASATAIITDPAPRIDVWTILQQGADAIARGENIYDMTWSGSPGVKDIFSYLPWTALLLAPGRWLAGDVRWALLVWSLVLYAGVWALVGGRRATLRHQWVAAAVIALLATVPGQLTQLDQAWTEPLLAACVVWWAVLVRRGHAWWAVVPLALACASKQHFAVLLPVLLLWRPFGARRAVATGALAGVLMLPWFIASPADFVHDTVTALVGFHAIRFANTFYLLALNVYGVHLPFWVTGLAVLGTLAAAGWLVWRRQPALPQLLRWLALVLLAANIVNKQAFYNQYWLTGALVALSLAAESGHGADEDELVSDAGPGPDAGLVLDVEMGPGTGLVSDAGPGPGGRVTGRPAPPAAPATGG